MKNRELRTLSGLGLAAGCIALALGLSGCAGEEEQQVVAAPPAYVPPPPPPPPKIASIDELMAELRIDPRVHLSEDRAPNSTEARKAVLTLFDAFARGNSRTLENMLTEADRRELRAMADDGTWERATQGITRIDVQTGSSAYGDCALALIESDGTFQAQLWYYTPNGERYTFEAAPTPPDIVNKLSGDWIQAWHEIIDNERELADRPDTPLQMPKRNVDEGDEQQTGPAPSGPGPGSPIGPLGPPPNQQEGPRRRAPGPRSL